MTAKRCGSPANALLLWHVNGTLEGSEEAAVREHVASCACCAEELALLSRLDAAIEEHGLALPSAAMELAAPRASLSRNEWSWPGWLLPAALAGLVVFGGSWLWMARGLPSLPHSEAARVFEVDLDGGPTRADSSLPVLEMVRGPGSVRVHFIRPAVSAETMIVEMRAPSGLLLAPADRPECESETGRCEVAFDAERFADSGSYELLVRGEQSSYVYPLQVMMR